MKPAMQWPAFDPEKGRGVGIEDGRTADYRFKLYDAEGGVLVIGVDDVIRFKLSEKANSEDLTLELTSAEATENGSSIEIVSVGDADDEVPAEVLVRFAQGDTDGLYDEDRPEDYFGELLLVDNSEENPADAVKRCGYGPVTVLPAAGGDVGL